MITFATTPVPVIVEGGKEAYLLYVESGGQLENDIWTCVHKEGGMIRHYLTSQVVVNYNSTFSILKNSING